MIPKKIHYCWLSGDPMPDRIRECLISWERNMPEYELVLWDMSKFNVDSVPYVREACQMRKWAFASDYIRLFALYSEGGIYLDSDVFVRKRLDDFLSHKAFSAVEYHPGIAMDRGANNMLNPDGSPKRRGLIIPGMGIQAAILGGEKGHRFFKYCMDSYKTRRFIQSDGTLNSKLIAPTIYAMVAEDFGFVYKDQRQELKEGLVVYSSESFAGHLNQATTRTYAIHLCAGSWRPIRKRRLGEKVMLALKRWQALRKLMGKRPIRTTIAFRLSSPGQVFLEIFTESGFLLQRTSLGQRLKGQHNVSWQCQNLPSGRYICRINNDLDIIKEFYLFKSPATE